VLCTYLNTLCFDKRGSKASSVEVQVYLCDLFCDIDIRDESFNESTNGKMMDG